MATYEYGKQVWDYFMLYIQNEYGVAGLMGNLAAESGIIPYRVQGDNTPPYTFSQDYTAQVDSGTITESEFVNDGPNGGGYGLAQWTYYTRKQNMYNLYQSGGYSSIGSIELGMDFLSQELQSVYSDVWDVLVNATSIREASDKVLHDFESPADQSEEVEEYRASLGQDIYNQYSGTGPGPGPGELGIPIWLLFCLVRKKVF